MGNHYEIANFFISGYTIVLESVLACNQKVTIELEQVHGVC